MAGNSVYYNMIPDYVFADKMIEIGPGDGTSQLTSRHKDKFLSSDYIGIDLRPSGPDSLLKIVEGDLLEYETSETYGTVFAIAVAEHIQVSKWAALFEKLKSWVAPGGYLIVLVPDDERVEDFIKGKDLKYYHEHYPPNVNCHVVFGINPNVLKYYMPGARVNRIRRQILLREPGEPMKRVVGRFLKRMVKGHHYAWDGILRKKHVLLGIWKKEN
ncbi:MAG: methyltransferase domain-containing protein [Candidatus Thorarchaeota archaeon]|nr:methyltransferase domain-containing protein [Candidatus Thorarchaeota archaeon]